MGPVCFWGGGTINIKKGPAALTTTRLQWICIGIGILFWFIDSAIDAFIFGEHTFIEQIIAPDPMDIWMRLLVVSLFIILGLYAQHHSGVEALAKKLEEEITLRKLAEEELKVLAKFPDENPNPVLRVANDGTILYANRASLSLLSFWRCQIGESLPDYWHQSILGLNSSGSTKEIEVDLVDRILVLALLPIAGTDYVDLYGRDVTEHKRAEVTLKESEERFRSIAQVAVDAIILADSSGRIIFWNRGAKIIFGYSDEEVMDKPITTLMPERYRDSHRRGLERFLLTGEGSVIGKIVELHGLRKDGREFPLELSISTWVKEKERYFGAIIRDISERKQTEEDLHKNYSLLNAVVEGSIDAIFVKDLQGRYLMINSPGARLIGRSVEEVIGKDDTELFEPEAASKIMEDDQKIMRSGETKTYEEELIATTGIKHTYLTTKRPYNVHKGKVIGIIGVARDITERKQAEEQIRHLAYYDILTDLPNRLMLRDDIDRAITAARKELVPFALLVVNLHRFKEINNTLGYQKGDIVLQQVGKRLKTILSSAFSIARTGGDEFGVLILNTDANIAVLEAEKIARGLKEPVFVEGFSLDLAVSVGIALFPGHGEDADTLIRRAHIAMHAAKQTESGYAIYTPEYDQFIPERLALIGELRSAIGQNQLFLVYQPKVDLKTGRTLGVESLVRWQHPETGLIPPDKFISLAEESGLIKQLTFWVLGEALRQSRAWSQAGLEVSVAVNLSIKNLRTPLLLDQIRGLLSTWGVSPGRLRLEITESLIMADPKLTIDILTRLTLMGICFSIDDFGTGYSSLRYLQRLPVDEIKIDKSFVLNMMTDESSMKIVRSTIELAHSLGLQVTAEGVESREVFDKLTALGCDAAQGYFISRPIPHPELTAWLGRQGRGPE